MPDNRWLRDWLTRVLVAAGVACLVFFSAATVETWHYQRRARLTLDQAIFTERAFGWAKDTRDSAPVLKRGDLIGRLDIPRLKLSAAVAEGDDDNTLKNAIGHLPDTPLPWHGRGNVAIAAHRDGLFRKLEHIKLNDEIRVTTPRGNYLYLVTKTHIVNPGDLWVVRPTEVPTLTLVTCYPFSFVGNAPQRFVVQAEMAGHRAGGALKGKVVQDKGR
jgi:sortase A